MDEIFLIELGKRFATHRKISLWRVGFIVANDGKFFARLERGGSCTLRVARSVTQNFSDRWPDDLDWPSDVLATAPRKDAA